MERKTRIDKGISKTSKWIEKVKAYMIAHRISYKQALIELSNKKKLHRHNI